MKQTQLACAGLAVLLLAAGGCASTRTQQAPGEAIDDRVVTGRVKSALIENPATKAGQIDVETFRGVVQLNGFVDSAGAKTQAATVARGVTGVSEVRNNLQVSSEKTSVGERIDDALITTRVKAALAADPAVKATQVNVETKDGMVQLSGFVDNAEAKAKAAELARGVSGVTSVNNQVDVKQKAAD